MESSSLIRSIKDESRKNYIAIFEQDWPAWLAGLFIAILALQVFLWSGSPWGIAGGYRNWGDWIFYLVGVYDHHPEFPPWLSTMSLSNFGLFLGALISALMSRQFKIRRAPAFEYVKAIIGGILMGTGAVLAAGCNVGGFYTAVAVFDLGGIAMMFGLGAGAYLGLRYLLWEMEHLPQDWFRLNSIKKPKAGGIKWPVVQPFVGGSLILFILGTFYVFSIFDETVNGGLLFFGFLIGFVMHRARFCFVRAFRCPFMTGEAEMVKSVAMSLMVYGLGAAVIKWSFIHDPMTGVYHNFWLGSMFGGMIFGVGMLVAGGCASSTLWRVGEGHTKLLVTLVTFALTNSSVAALMKKLELFDKLGQGIFLPDIISWYLTIPVFIIFLLCWTFVAIWNEASEKFVVF